MSYDVDVGEESFNYTYNVSQLFYDHIPEREGEQGGLYAINGKTGAEAVVILSEAFRRIHQTKMDLWLRDVVGEPEFCARYDAQNGWGSAVGGLLFLARILAACALAPDSLVRVS